MTSIRRMLASGVLAAGVLGATTASAQAAVTASFSGGVLTVNGTSTLIMPTENDQSMTFPAAIRTFEVDRNFYVQAEQRK